MGSDFDLFTGHGGNLDSTQVGQKRLREDGDPEIFKPKMQKVTTDYGLAHRVKASDFDDITREVLAAAISIFRCLICTKAPFPPSALVESQLAKEAWREAVSQTDLNVQLTPALMSLVISPSLSPLLLNIINY
jgi:hypothetical protein